MKVIRLNFDSGFIAIDLVNLYSITWNTIAWKAGHRWRHASPFDNETDELVFNGDTRSGIIVHWYVEGMKESSSQCSNVMLTPHAV